MKWKKNGLRIVVTMVGFYGASALAGPVLSGGGGDGGQINFGPDRGVSLGSGYNNDFADRDSRYAWANANGPIVPTEMSSWFLFTPSNNPEPGNAGRLEVAINLQGDFIPSDGTVTPVMQALSQNPLRTSGSFRINEVTVEEGDKFIIYHFNPTLQISWSGAGSFYLDPDGVKHRGYLDANVWLDGGAFNDARPYFELNDWEGDGPRPDWLADWSANFNFSGLATPTSVTVVPEPATLGLFGLGVLTAIHHGRRRFRLEHNPIG